MCLILYHIQIKSFIETVFKTEHTTFVVAFTQHFIYRKEAKMEFSLNGKEGTYQKVERYDQETTAQLSDYYKKIIDLLGENSNREGLRQTPLRVAKSMQFLLQGYEQDPEKILRSAMFKEDYRQMVIVKDIEIYSMCEHHILPFIGKAHIGYIPNGYITGLSKIARVVDAYARRLQVQERLTTQIKDCIQQTLNPLGVAVVIEAQHLCMQMRGVQKQHSITTTSDFTGAFERVATREEFIRLIRS